jgi:hypothetical protein
MIVNLYRHGNTLQQRHSLGRPGFQMSSVRQLFRAVVT